jgi:Ca2+/Na+ antiporter
LRSLRGAFWPLVLVSVLAAVSVLLLVDALGVVDGLGVVVVVDVLGLVVVLVSVFVVSAGAGVPDGVVEVDCATAKPTPAISDTAAAARVRRLDGVMT